MMALAALEFPEWAEVVVPSFTFAATVQPLLWNRLTPVYVDCLPGTMTTDPDEVVKAIGPNTSGILGVNVYGLPPDIGPLEGLAQKHGLTLLFDSAQGLGAAYGGRPTGGFGACEVFSLSPTKVITAIEGGIVTTRDAELAGKLRSMRDYGTGPDGRDGAHRIVGPHERIPRPWAF
jgi:dTDP-4-amino-4,6-dideoxygalactose transaminase